MYASQTSATRAANSETIEYAKYTDQDVSILHVDIAKAFITIQWDFIAQTMTRMGFGPKIVNALFWLYMDSFVIILSILFIFIWERLK